MLQVRAKYQLENTIFGFVYIEKNNEHFFCIDNYAMVHFILCKISDFLTLVRYEAWKLSATATFLMQLSIREAHMHLLGGSQALIKFLLDV